MKRLRWVAVSIVERVGYAGAAALALFVVLGAAYWFAVHPLQERMNELRNTAVLAATPSPDEHSTRNNPRDELVEFRALFKRGSLEDQLQAIHDAAKATGINLKRVEYRMLEEKRSQLKQYQIVMPVGAPYPRIRQFLALALAKVPAMALDHVSFQRKKIGDTVVDTELRFTLFLAEPT